MTEEELREQKLQIYQQYGITEEQLDAFVAALHKVWEALKNALEIAAAYLSECFHEYAEKNAEAFREAMQQADLSALAELAETIESIRGAEPSQSLPSYSLANTKQYNAMQRQKLKSYKNRIGSAAIRRPKRIARSCC